MSLLGNKKKPSSVETGVSKIFDKYKDPEDESQISVDGTMAYLTDLQLSPDDLTSLTLAFFLGSPSLGIFPREPFIANWTNVNVSTIPEMQNFIREYHQKSILSNKGNYRKLYDFSFDYSKENAFQKVIGYDIAIEYWKLLFVSQTDAKDVVSMLNKWFDFIANHYKKNFSRDTWDMFYLFYTDVILKDPVKLKDYDEMSAWPSAIDEFVEYLQENNLLELRYATEH